MGKLRPIYIPNQQIPTVICCTHQYTPDPVGTVSPTANFFKIGEYVAKSQTMINMLVYATILLDRGYPLGIIEEAVIKARRLDRDELINPTTQANKSPADTIILTMTYQPQDNNLKEIVTKNWDPLGKHTKTT